MLDKNEAKTMYDMKENLALAKIESMIARAHGELGMDKVKGNFNPLCRNVMCIELKTNSVKDHVITIISEALLWHVFNKANIMVAADVNWAKVHDDKLIETYLNSGMNMILAELGTLEEDVTMEIIEKTTNLLFYIRKATKEFA